jgi:hypothetical protein
MVMENKTCITAGTNFDIGKHPQTHRSVQKLLGKYEGSKFGDWGPVID